MKNTSSAAVVLKVFDHGESDKIVTLYCRDTGKVTGIAKGAKKSTKRFVNKLEIFSELEICYGKNRNSSLVYITEADLLNPYFTLRSDYNCYIAASLIIELVTIWTRENDVDENLYSLLTWTLNCLNDGRPILPNIIFFLTKLFNITGYRPYLSGCSKCGQLVSTDGFFSFNTLRNGLLCGVCSQGAFSATSIPLSLSTIKLLQNSQDLPLEKLNRLRFSKSSTREAITLLKKYGEHLLQREVHSWSALTKII